MSRSRACTLYLLVLVGSDRGEDSLREAEHLEDAPADTEEVIGLHDVKARLVPVHGVQDDLGQTKDKVSMCHHCHTLQIPCADPQDTHFQAGTPAGIGVSSKPLQ